MIGPAMTSVTATCYRRSQMYKYWLEVAKTLLALLTHFERMIVWIGLVSGWALLLPIIFSRFYDIVARQYTDVQSNIVQYIEWDGFFLLICLIFGFAYFRDAHARIDILRGRFSNYFKAWIEIIGIAVFVGPFCVICVAYGIEHAQAAYRFDEKWWIPFADGWVKKTIIPIGFSLLLISSAVILLRNVVFLITGQGKPEPQPPEGAHTQDPAIS